MRVHTEHVLTCTHTHTHTRHTHTHTFTHSHTHTQYAIGGETPGSIRRRRGVRGARQGPPKCRTCSHFAHYTLPRRVPATGQRVGRGLFAYFFSLLYFALLCTGPSYWTTCLPSCYRGFRYYQVLPRPLVISLIAISLSPKVMSLISITAISLSPVC